MRMIHICRDPVRASLRLLSGCRNLYDDPDITYGHIQVIVRAQQFAEIHLRIHRIVLGQHILSQEILRTQPHDHPFAGILRQGVALKFRNSQLVLAEHRIEPAAFRRDLHIQEVHLRAADKSCHKQVHRLLIQCLGRIKLLYDPVLHHHDAVAHGHSLCLVMGYIHKGNIQSLVQLRDLRSHGSTELRVQVGKRLIQQKYRRIPNHRTAQGHTLSLAAGKLLRLPGQQMLQVQDLRRLMHTLVDLSRIFLAQL